MTVPAVEGQSPRGALPPGALAEMFLKLPAEKRLKALASLTGEEAAALEADIHARVRANLVDWCRLALAPSKQAPAKHHRLLLDELADIASGENDRLIVTMPPGSAKSTYTSDLFPPWFMAQAPNQCVIAASHTSGLAEYFSRRAMGRVTENGDALGISLKGEAAESWGTSNGSEYKAAGVGGSITGRRADLGIIDDPFPGIEQADSVTFRNRVWEWFEADFLTRLKPTGRIVIIMTRWHEDDLVGRLLEREPDRWRVLHIPMEAEEDDPLGREPGELLWPEYFRPEQVEAAKSNSRNWNALFQGHPAPAAGALFLADKIGGSDGAARIVRSVRAWDLAATEAGAVTGGGRRRSTNPDWTVGLKLGVTETKRLVVMDIVRLRGGPEAVQRAIVETAARDGHSVPVGLPQDPGQAGKAQGQALAAALLGYTVVVSPETGSKVTRANPVAAQCNVGNLTVALDIPQAVARAFIEEVRNFPAGRFDDQVDALSRAASMLVVAARPARGVRLGFMTR